MQPLISVIVAIYKVEPYLDKCIQSILNQTYKNLEIILVDDGSPDNCPAICDKYAQQDKRIKVIHKNNGGLVSARKAGVNIATGQYVSLLDGDDWVDTGYIATLVWEMLDTKADLIITNFVVSYPNKEISRPQGVPGLYEKEALLQLKKHFLYSGKFYIFGLSPTVWNKLFITHIVQQIYHTVPNDLTLGEDVALTIPYVAQSKKLCIIQTNQVYHYIQRKSSMTNSYNLHLFQKIYNLLNFLKPLTQNPTWNSQVIYYATYMLIASIQNELRNINCPWNKTCQNLYRLNSIPLYTEIRQLSYQKFNLYHRLILWSFFNSHYRLLQILYTLKSLIRFHQKERTF